MTTLAMASEIRSFAVTIPAGTAADSPLTTLTSMPPRTVVAVTWQVPPGPSGLMGWRLTMSGGNPVIPVGGGWIIADNRSETWPVTGYPDGGQWEVTGYNTDQYDHTVYVEFLVQQLAPAPAPARVIPATLLVPPPPVPPPPALTGG